MSSSKFLLFGTSLLFRTCKTTAAPYPSSRLYLRPFPPRTLSIYRCSASAAATAEPTSDSLSSPLHPWPEWVTFVDRLKSRGYLVESSSHGDDDAKSAAAESENIYKDINKLKDACLSFARDRYDIFKSLPMKDIQTVVEAGCPNLLRKSVNSAKRLRLYVQLDEGDVCGACDLRGSCDRAYVIIKDSEAAARTIDLVRILLSYALDPLMIMGEDKPERMEIIEGSAKKLLAELIDLSDSSPAPPIEESVTKVSQRKVRTVNVADTKNSGDVEMKREDWMCPKCNFVNFSRNKQCRECKEDAPKRASSGEAEMKRGDWMCPKCNFVNFSRNKQCRECKEDGPKRASYGEVEMKKGDWICQDCNIVNFSRNIRCFKCKAEGPKRVSIDDVEMKKGDWNCTRCGFMNFANNTECLRCRDPRPKRQLKPGEWECPSCDFLNYRKNMSCLKCNCDRPTESSSLYEEQLWRKPR